MNKEYTQALDDLFGLVAFQKSLTKEQFRRAQKHFEILESALQRLESIDNANPIEALIKLDDIRYLVLNEIDDLKNKELWKSYFDTIKEALLKAQNLKALEVIKKNPYNSGICLTYLKSNSRYSKMKDYEHYCMTIRECDRVNEEEFNLLKEALNE